jgi:tetratricopeptide (TPR) repeat protein
MKLFSVLAFSLLLLSSIAFADSDQDVWLAANTAYDNSEFQLAIDSYLKLLEKGIRTPEIYYNLGNAYFKTEQIGLAIAAFRHCLRIDHAFEPARENLHYVRQFTVDKVEEKPKGFLFNIWYGIAGIFSPAGYFIFTIAVFWMLIAALSVLILGFGKKELLTYLLILLAILFILGSVITYSVVDEELNTKWGVLTATSAELREGPGEDFEKIFTGHEGLEFKILSQRQNFYLVELRNGLKGWIKSSLLTEI